MKNEDYGKAMEGRRKACGSGECKFDRKPPISENDQGGNRIQRAAARRLYGRSSLDVGARLCTSPTLVRRRFPKLRVRWSYATTSCSALFRERIRGDLGDVIVPSTTINRRHILGDGIFVTRRSGLLSRSGDMHGYMLAQSRWQSRIRRRSKRGERGIRWMDGKTRTLARLFRRTRGRPNVVSLRCHGFQQRGRRSDT